MEYAGIPVLSVMQFRRLVSETPQGREVDIRINRAGSERTLNAEIGERDSAFGWIERFGPDVRLPRIEIDDLELPRFDFGDLELPRFELKGDQGRFFDKVTLDLAK